MLLNNYSIAFMLFFYYFAKNVEKYILTITAGKCYSNNGKTKK